MAESDSDPFPYDGGTVLPGETAQFRYTVSETYLGDPVRIPVTIINGVESGPTAFLSAAVHGDELNGIAVVREVAQSVDHTDIHGTIVCLPVLNVPGFVTQQRYLPIYERDLNRAFPGKEGSTSANRIAHTIYTNFIEPCDLGIDFHTSTRGRTNMFHVRADMEDDAASRLARSFGTNLIVSGSGSSGMLRREATESGIPTITVEMGEAHRFERDLIDHALGGIESVFAEYGIYPQETVRWPGWTSVVEGWEEKTWLRADAGGIVEMEFSRGELVGDGKRICTISSPFHEQQTEVRAPFTGILVGILENPVVYPGNPLCHLVQVDSRTRTIIEDSRE
ncbi:MAG: succinylglutamate desuccinylase/aspartoacylase family protein [Halobacteriales archaeon]